MPLGITGQPPVAADPSDGSLHNPTLPQHDEFVLVAAADDLDLPRAGAGDGGGQDDAPVP
jgi:hypothetical protein